MPRTSLIPPPHFLALVAGTALAVLLPTRGEAQRADWAGTGVSRAAYDRCMDAASTNADFSACGEQELARLEAALTDAWKAASASLSAESRTTLLNEQRAWIRFKDLACAYYANEEDFGREGGAIGYPACKAVVLAERIRYLRLVAERE